MTQKEWENLLVPGATFEARELTKEEVSEMIKVIEEYEQEQERRRIYLNEHWWEIMNRRITI